MEKYKLVKSKTSEISLGYFCKLINEKHKIKYGEDSALSILKNVREIYIKLQNQLADPLLNKNALLVGKVQSGKTSNLEMLTALSFDNGYNAVIIYGGYDDTLLTQTKNRFEYIFDISDSYKDKRPVIFSTDDSNKISDLDDEIVEDLIEADKPIIFISMKRPKAMSKIYKALKKIDTTKLNCFIIDDEGDQASLNASKDKKKIELATATYKEIVKLKRILNNPLYISVTATPHANIFLDNISEVKPDSIHLIEPGKGYHGADTYHLYESDKIEDEDINQNTPEINENGSLSNELRTAIDYFMIASAIMKKKGISQSDMIIHSHRTNTEQKEIYDAVDAYIQEFKDLIKNCNQDDLKIKFANLNQVFNRFVNDNEKSKHDFHDLFDTILKVVERIYVILKNSKGKKTQANETMRKHKIYIGGDLLQRGLTFDNLVTTYFTRWPKSGGNMDTNMQRARWFGYRSKFINLCKIFTTEEISSEFATLANIEEDLWEQFYAIEDGELKIEDILIEAENTKQKPSRRTVVNIKKIKFKNRWVKQKFGIFDEAQLSANNKIIIDFINNNEFKETSVGRRDAKTCAEYITLSSEEAKSLIDQMQTVFDLDPFEKKSLNNLIENSFVNIILMKGVHSEGRERSFYNGSNKIKALLQGADNTDKTQIVYEGDSNVIIDKNMVNIQIHKIIPKRNKIILTDKTQFMFAIYFPKEKTYYVRGYDND